MSALRRIWLPNRYGWAACPHHWRKCQSRSAVQSRSLIPECHIGTQSRKACLLDMTLPVRCQLGNVCHFKTQGSSYLPNEPQHLRHHHFFFFLRPVSSSSESAFSITNSLPHKLGGLRTLRVGRASSCHTWRAGMYHRTS